jgi:hypothetical protein
VINTLEYITAVIITVVKKYDASSVYLTESSLFCFSLFVLVAFHFLEHVAAEIVAAVTPYDVIDEAEEF